MKRPVHFSICRRNKAKGVNVWYLRVFDPNEQTLRYKSLHTARKSDALDILARYKMGEFSDPGEMLDAMDAPAAVNDYIGSLAARMCSPWTIRSFASTLNAFLRFARIAKVGQIRTQTAEEFIAHCAGNGNRANSVRKKNAILRGWYKWLCDKCDITRQNPFKRARTPRAEKPARGFWTPWQIAQILNAAKDPEHRLFYALMAYEGLRFSECAALRWEQFRGGWLEVVGKGNKRARVPVSTAADRELNLFGKEESGKIFSGLHSVAWENECLRRICAGLFPGDPSPVHTHRFRHSFGSNLIRAGVNIVAVSRLMRHETPAITMQHYAHILQSDLPDAINAPETKGAANG